MSSETDDALFIGPKDVLQYVLDERQIDPYISLTKIAHKYHLSPKYVAKIIASLDLNPHIRKEKEFDPSLLCKKYRQTKPTQSNNYSTNFTIFIPIKYVQIIDYLIEIGKAPNRSVFVRDAFYWYRDEYFPKTQITLQQIEDHYKEDPQDGQCE